MAIRFSGLRSTSEDQQEDPFQGLHRMVNDIHSPFLLDMFGKGIAIAVVIATQRSDGIGVFLRYLFKGIGDTELAIGGNQDCPWRTHPLGLDNMPTNLTNTEWCSSMMRF